MNRNLLIKLGAIAALILLLMVPILMIDGMIEERQSLRDGVLTVSAESTAWATQLRMVQAQLLAKIAAAVGDGVVTSLKIQGPVAPSWRKGNRSVPGRGPRDTYG